MTASALKTTKCLADESRSIRTMAHDFDLEDEDQIVKQEQQQLEDGGEE